MPYRQPIMGNFLLNHPLLSGIKLMVVFVWWPACHDMTMDAYTHFYLPFIVPLFYGTEIISFGLTLFGFGDLVDETLGGSDLTFIPYSPYQNYVCMPPVVVTPPPPIVIHETSHHHYF